MWILIKIIFKQDHFIECGILIREDENQDVFHKFYVYELNYSRFFDCKKSKKTDHFAVAGLFSYV